MSWRHNCGMQFKQVKGHLDRPQRTFIYLQGNLKGQHRMLTLIGLYKNELSGLLFLEACFMFKAMLYPGQFFQKKDGTQRAYHGISPPFLMIAHNVADTIPGDTLNP